MKIDKEKIKRRKNVSRKLVNIRVPLNMSKWLRKNDYSPTAIFYEAVKSLGYKEE